MTGKMKNSRVPKPINMEIITDSDANEAEEMDGTSIVLDDNKIGQYPVTKRH